MSKLGQNNNRDYSKFDQMSTEALEEILKLDLQLPDDDSDINAILYIMEVIAKREKKAPTGRFTDVDSAWASFNENYRPVIGDVNSLYEDDDAETSFESDIEPTPIRESSNRLLKWKNRFFIRVVSITATIVLLFFAGTVTAYAFGYDLWGTVAQWTKETFGFAFSDSVESQIGYSNLQEALADYGISEPLVPTWIPDGYKLSSIDITETPARTSFLAIYENNSDKISISIINVSNGSTGTYEKDNNEITIYEANNVEHYIMTNNGRGKAVWIYDSYECSISANIPETTIERMIDSIYER